MTANENSSGSCVPLALSDLSDGNVCGYPDGSIFNKEGVAKPSVNEWHNYKYIVELDKIGYDIIKYYVDDVLVQTYDKNDWHHNDSNTLYFFNTITDFTKLGKVFLRLESEKIKVKNVRVGYQNDLSKSYWNGEEVTIMEIGTAGKMTLSNNHKYDTYKIYSGTNIIYQFNYSAANSEIENCGPWRGYYENYGDGPRFMSFIINEDEQLARPYILSNYSADMENECAHTGYDLPSYQEMRDMYNLLKDNIVTE